MLGLGAHGGPYGHEGHSGAGHMEHVGLDDYLVHGGRRLHDGYYLHQGEAGEINSQLRDHVHRLYSDKFGSEWTITMK